MAAMLAKTASLTSVATAFMLLRIQITKPAAVVTKRTANPKMEFAWEMRSTNVMRASFYEFGKEAMPRNESISVSGEGG
jgi:hypothetical protein